jgi:hypothetical protein
MGAEHKAWRTSLAELWVVFYPDEQRQRSSSKSHPKS